MPLTDRRKLAKCGQRPGQLEGIVCAMCPGRLGPVSDKDTASEWLVCIPLLPVGLSFKARLLLFGMEFQWGKVSLGPSSSCLDLLQWLSSLWFGRVVLSSAIFFFFTPNIQSANPVDSDSKICPESPHSCCCHHHCSWPTPQLSTSHPASTLALYNPFSIE